MKTRKSCLSRRRFLEAGATCLGAATALGVPREAIALAQEIPNQITSMSASQLSAAIRAQQVSWVEVMQAYLARIHRYNPTYNAIVSMVDDDELVRQAALADRALESNELFVAQDAGYSTHC